jgi:hypothetical protein
MIEMFLSSFKADLYLLTDAEQKITVNGRKSLFLMDYHPEEIRVSQRSLAPRQALRYYA